MEKVKIVDKKKTGPGKGAVISSITRHNRILGKGG